MIFLLIDVQTLVSVDRADQCRLDTADTLLGEETFFGGSGEDDHVDMEVLLFFVECRIPTQMIRMDLIALGDVRDGGVDECLPVLNVCISQPLRIFTREGDDRCPHISLMLCHFCYGILQRDNFSIDIPQTVFAQRFYAGTVCNIVQIVFSAVHRHDEIFVYLFDEVKGSLPIGCVCIVLMLW